MNKGRILLVGGDPDVTRTLQLYLCTHQFSVESVTRGDEALAACRRSPTDALIVSWRLPDMDADRLCEEIRADQGVQSSVILVLLPANERSARLAALEAGADDVMFQPIDIEELRLKIEGISGVC